MTAQSASSSAMLALIMTISKKESNKYVEVGKISYYCPTLEAFGYQPELALDAEGRPLIEEGLPVYKTDSDNWLMGAVHAAVKALVRNRLVSGTAVLKPGLSIPATMADLTAESERTGNGAYLKVIADLRKQFGAWVASLGKSQGAQALLTSLFANKSALAVQSPDNKAKMAGYIADFAASLEPEQLEAGQRYLQGLLDTCAADVDADDF
jgi:hypothetical protein